MQYNIIAKILFISLCTQRYITPSEQNVFQNSSFQQEQEIVTYDCIHPSPRMDVLSDQKIDQYVFLATIEKFKRAIIQEKPINDDNGINTLLSIVDPYDLNPGINYQNKFYGTLRQGPNVSIKRALNACKEDSSITYAELMCTSNCIEGLQPLHWAAAWHNQPNITKVLLAHNARLDAVDMYGNLPLDNAVINNNYIMTDFIIAHGGKCCNPHTIKKLLIAGFLPRIILTNNFTE